MKKKQSVCIDPALITKQFPGSAFFEGRALLLGFYLENELSPEVREKTEAHLQKCESCADFLRSLDEEVAPGSSRNEVVFAVCPSSASLDLYLFDPNLVAGEEKKRIAKHLEDCPLCSEEIAWLKRLEEEKVIPYQNPPRKWPQYLSYAAAALFLVISSVLWWQRTQAQVPEQELRRLAVIKEPHQIDYIALEQTSATLSPELESIYQDGIHSMQSLNFEEASAKFEKVIQELPDHSASTFLLGYCYYKMNHPEKAFALCDRAERMHPHAYERCMSLVHIALKTGHFSRALKEITVLYHDAPHIPEVRELYHRITELTQGRILEL